MAGVPQFPRMALPELAPVQISHLDTSFGTQIPEMNESFSGWQDLARREQELYRREMEKVQAEREISFTVGHDLQTSTSQREMMSRDLNHNNMILSQADAEFQSYKKQMLNRDEEHRKQRHQLHDQINKICDNTTQQVGKARETLGKSVAKMEESTGKTMDALDSFYTVTAELESHIRNTRVDAAPPLRLPTDLNWSAIA